MDPHRYTALAHTGIDLWHPHDEGALEDLIDARPLAAGTRVLDVGCGRGEVALRVAARTPAEVVGVDPSGPGLGIAREQAAQRGLTERTRWVEERFPHGIEGPFDLVVCIGSSQAVGGPLATRNALAPWLALSGTLLVGELFWRDDPDPAWVEAIWGNPSVLPHREELEASLAAGGGQILAHHTVSDAGWWDYETRHHGNVRRWAEAHPDHPHAEAALARSTAWHDAWKRWGVGVLGFGLWRVAPNPG